MCTLLSIQGTVQGYFYSESTLSADSTLHIWWDVNKKGFEEYFKNRCMDSTTPEERVKDGPMGTGSEAPALSGPGPGTPPGDRGPRLLASERGGGGTAGLTPVRPPPAAALPHRLPPRLR